MIMRKIIFSIITLSMISVFFDTTADSKTINAYKSIYPSEAKEIMNTEKNIVILDVRTPGEYENCHIPNAVLISHTEINEKAEELIPDKQSKVLVYCQNGMRAISAAKRLVKLGYTNVCVFGGIINWEYETVK
ncbi:rhodanese-like domain-containing protein [Elusimicrobiota bacterium]